ELREQATLRVADGERDGERDGAACDPLADAEVKKNHTIAVLAQGMHDMAEQAQQGRWAEADRALRRAIDTARAPLPHLDDKDVCLVLGMADGHARPRLPYVDRVRDYE